MERIEFRAADGTKCRGYLFTWEGLSFGLTRDLPGSSNWSVIELQTGRLVTAERASTRKEAIRKALELLNNKGIRTVKDRIKEVLLERANKKVRGKIKTAHCTSQDNRLNTLCGRAKSEHCLPVKYFKYAKRPCKKCQRLAKKKKAG